MKKLILALLVMMAISTQAFAWGNAQTTNVVKCTTNHAKIDCPESQYGNPYFPNPKVPPYILVNGVVVPNTNGVANPICENPPKMCGPGICSCYDPSKPSFDGVGYQLCQEQVRVKCASGVYK